MSVIIFSIVMFIVFRAAIWAEQHDEMHQQEQRFRDGTWF